MKECIKEIVQAIKTDTVAVFCIGLFMLITVVSVTAAILAVLK